MCDKVDNACNDRPQQVSYARPTGGQRIGKLLIFGHIGADRFPQQRPDAARAKQAECKFLRAGNQPAKLAVHLLAVEQHFCHAGCGGLDTGHKRPGSRLCRSADERRDIPCAAGEAAHKAFRLLCAGAHFIQTGSCCGQCRFHLRVLRRVHARLKCGARGFHFRLCGFEPVIFLCGQIKVVLQVFPLGGIFTHAESLHFLLLIEERFELLTGFFSLRTEFCVFLRRELRLTDCIQPFLKLRNLAFQRACLALKGGHSALAAGHGFLEGRFQLLHAAVHGVDLTLQTGCLFRHTTDVHLRCSCFRRRRAAAVGIL